MATDIGTAGGRDWVLVDKDDSGRLFQKESNGPWYLQFGIVIEITRKVHRRDVDLTAGDYGRTARTVACQIGDQYKTRTLATAERFVCRADRTRRIDEVSDYLQRTQVWQWLDDEADAEEIAWNVGA